MTLSGTSSPLMCTHGMVQKRNRSFLEETPNGFTSQKHPLGSHSFPAAPQGSSNRSTTSVRKLTVTKGLLSAETC